MRRTILDTDTLSEYLKAYDGNVVRKARAYIEQHDQFEFTSVSVHEVLHGLRAKRTTAQMARFVIWAERNLEHVPLSDDYRVAAEIRGAVQTQGRVLELSDCLIAAVASRLGLPLVTGNTAHFEAIREAGLALELENWRRQ